jgi:RNA polymerase sigma-70 factor (ECF subfamily)
MPRGLGNFCAYYRDYMSVDDDGRLLEQARRGDEVAFSTLFARHQRSVFRYAVYMAGRDAADDVVQETFLAVLRQTGRSDALRGPVVSYLLGIARHVVMKRSRRGVFDEPLEEIGDAALAEDGPSALDDLTREETIASVRTAVQSLPPAYREVVVLCELNDMDYAAAAALMQCPIGTVRSRLSRARALLTIKLNGIEPPCRTPKIEIAR